MTAPTAAPPRHDGQRPPRLRTPSPSTQATARHRGRIGAGAVLLTISAILAVLVYGNLGDRSAVLAAAAEIRPGQMIEESDVKVVRVAADPDVATVPASRRADIVGKRAAVGLTPGSLLAPESVTAGPGVPAGNTIIGAVVKPGQYPIGLREGDEIVVLVVSEGSENSSGVEAVIVSVSSRSGPEGTAIALAVPSANASALARAGAQGRLILTRPVP
jgi:hypothetical protein